MQKQKERSSSKSKIKYSDWNIIDENAESNFIGYDKLKSEMNLIRFREVDTENGMNIHLVFDTTPFYAESGGQIGDTGTIESSSKEVIEITDTIKDNDYIIHVTNKMPNNQDSLFTGIVDSKRRQQITSNHTSTHLLNLALKKIVGAKRY